MAHFSNGTEGMMYQEQYCDNCKHWSDDHGCPIWLLHELHVGEPDWQPALDKMIPVRADQFADECATYWPIKAPKAPRP